MRVVSFIIFLILISTVYPESFGVEPKKQAPQYIESNISKNYPANDKQLVLSFVAGISVILLGIFLSYRLMIDSCNEDTTPVSGADGGPGV